MNEFEEYLREHKEKLGTIKVDPIIWSSIENELLSKNNHRIRLYLRIAVSFLLLIASVTIISYTLYKSRSIPQFSLSIYSPEYGQMEKDFQKVIYYQTNQMRSFEIPHTCESDFAVLINEIKALDKQYKIYTDRIDKYGYNEDVGNKILEYYSLKLELLKKIEFEIIKINNFKKNNTNENNKIHVQI